MRNIAPRFALTMAAFVPLFAAWTVRSFGTAPQALWILCLALAALPLAFWWKCIAASRRGAEREFELEHDDIEGGHTFAIPTANLLMVQMVVGVAADVSARTLLAAVLLVMVAALVLLRQNLEAINPTATLFGFWVFHAKTTDGASCIVVSRRSAIKGKVFVRSLLGDVFLEADWP